MDIRSFLQSPKPEWCERCSHSWDECLCDNFVLAFQRAGVRAKPLLPPRSEEPLAGVMVEAAAIVRVFQANGPQTSRQIAKALGVHKHDINKTIYANPDVFERVNDKSVHVPVWDVKASYFPEEEQGDEDCEWCGFEHHPEDKCD